MNRRALLRLVSLAAAERLRGAQKSPPSQLPHRLVLVTLGGIRRQESFSAGGLENVPRLHGDLLPKALYFPYCLNEGVTSHFNTISSILTGTWQHVDDWGRELPRQPTLIQYMQEQLRLPPAQTWVVTSNKALTAKIGAGGNVILSKQLLIEAVERIILGYSSRKKLERELLLEELTDVMQQDYERIGWEVPSPAATMDPRLKETFLTALAGFMKGPDNATSGDELTFMVASEVLRRVEPALLVVNFSDMEVAHSGVFSAYVGGIRRADTLCYRLWNLLQSLPVYRETATLVIMSEFGRDPDGSTTNGFFNHRTDTEECRLTWMIVLGKAVQKPAVVERVVRHIDVVPSLAALLGVRCAQASGERLPELRVRT